MTDFFFHSDPRGFKNGPVYPIQKRNKRIDEAKNEWALLNGYTILRFWEYDIKNNTSEVIKTLKKYIK